MKNFTPIVFLFLIVCLSSCVSRIDIPEEEDSKLFVSLEMLRGENKLVADISTSNNLNGTSPISIPTNAYVAVNQPGTDYTIILNHDSDSGKYIADVTTDFLSFGTDFKLRAEIKDSEIPEVSAITRVPLLTKIDEFSLIDEEYISEPDGSDYWVGTLGLTFSEPINNVDRFGHIVLSGFTRDQTIINGEPTTIDGSEERVFELLDVNVGNGAVTDVLHREGFFISFDELENEYLEITIKSPFPLSEENDIRDILSAKLISISNDHYDYHLSYHFILKNQGNVFDENTLFLSNIDNGLGLFSSCSQMNQLLELK